MRTASLTDISTLKKLGIATAMAIALAACGGGSGSDDDNGTDKPSDGYEEAGCFDECKKFLAALVDDFAVSSATATKSTKSVDDNLDIIVEGDQVTFAVASVAVDAPHPGELNEAFPVSGSTLAYKLIINKATGDITVDNNDGKTFTVQAYSEATYFQEIDYGKTDLADINKAHYAYLNFDPKELANSIDRHVNLRRQWVQENGEAYPVPGVSILLNTPFQDCPGAQDVCDMILLTANPEMHEDQGNVPAGAHVAGTVSGTSYNATQISSGGNYQLDISVGNTLTAQTSGGTPDIWSIQNLMAKVGTYACGTSDGVANITFMNSSALAGDPLNSWKYMNLTTAHSDEGGQCSVTVTKADEDSLEGTFTATIVGLGLAPGDVVTYNVTSGSFNIPKQ